MNKTIAKIFAAIFALALITSQFWSCSTAQLLSSGLTASVVDNRADAKIPVSQPRGGVKFVLKVDVSEKFLNLTPEKEEKLFQKAYQLAKENQQGSDNDFINLFEEAYQQVAPEQLFAKYFINTPEAQNQIQISSSNEVVLTVIREIIDGYIEETHKALKERIDSLKLNFTVVLLDEQSNRITIKIGAEQDLNRFKDYLAARGTLEFWDAYSNEEVYDELVRLHDELKTRGVDDNNRDSVLLFKLLTPIMPDNDGSRIARIGEAEADNVNKTTTLLTGKAARNILSQGLHFVWDVREPFILGDKGVYQSLYALNIQNRGPPRFHWQTN
jgi:hypothetical protein